MIDRATKGGIHETMMENRRNSFEYEDLLACGRKELFVEGPQLPLPPMLMFDRISEIAEMGGEYGKGLVRAVLEVRPDLAAELHLADGECAPAPGRAVPAHEKADQLPHGVKAQTTRHHRIAPEVAFEEPAIGADIELRFDPAFAIGAAAVRDVFDAIEHQHRRQRQLRIAWSVQSAFAGGDQVFIGK